MKEIDIVKRASHINNECLIVLAGNSKVGSEKDSKIQKTNRILWKTVYFLTCK